MRLQDCKENCEYDLIDDNNEVVAVGFLYEAPDSNIYDKPKMNYFIRYEYIQEDSYCIKRELVDQLIKVAKEKRKSYPEMGARVYHCCFAENTNLIDFYKTIEGFKADEFMYIYKLKLNGSMRQLSIGEEYKVIDNKLDTDECVEELLLNHGKAFHPGLYSKEDIKELKTYNGFQCTSIYKADKMVANLIVYIDEYGRGILEDLFVNKEVRRQGIAHFLVDYASNYMNEKQVKEITLEVWSENDKALNLYKSSGYEYDYTTEVSIGMSI